MPLKKTEILYGKKVSLYVFYIIFGPFPGCIIYTDKLCHCVSSKIIITAEMSIHFYGLKKIYCISEKKNKGENHGNCKLSKEEYYTIHIT